MYDYPIKGFGIESLSLCGEASELRFSNTRATTPRYSALGQARPTGTLTTGSTPGFVR